MSLNSPTMCSFGLLSALVFLAELWTVGSSRDGCPMNVQRSRHFAKVHDKICFLFVDHERYWDDAKSACVRMGGEMLSIEDYGTMRFIQSVLNSEKLGWRRKGVWLGARYSGGEWRWPSGKSLGWAKWAPGEPSKILGLFSMEDCALMLREDHWLWHDYSCSRYFSYICQFPVQNFTTTTTTTTTTSTTTMATVFKPGHSSKKGAKVNQGGSHQQDNEMVEGSDESDAMQNDGPYKDEVPRYHYERRPAFHDRGYNEVHTSQAPDNGNLTLLTIILVTGAIVLMSLFLIFLIVRKRYNYKAAIAQPTVHFENQNFNHSHNNPTGHTTPLPPPPAPHSFHRPSAPPLPPRPLATLPPYPSLPTHASPLLSHSYLPHSRPASDLYLTPVDIGGGGRGEGVYEELGAPKYASVKHTTNLARVPARSVDALEACGSGMYPLEREDSATIPLITSSDPLWGQSEESLHSMSGSLTIKTSSIHNDYVDMNGSPVVPPRNNIQEAGTSLSKTTEGKESDPKDELSLDNAGNGTTFHEEGKQAFRSDYSNLMTTSMERRENLYAQLH